MNTREIREQLGRVKPYYLRNETLRALAAMISALKELAGAPQIPAELKGLIYEGAQLLTRDPRVKAVIKGPLNYQPGQERALLLQLALAYKAIREAENYEPHNDALSRKIKLDQAYNLGLRLLEQGQVSEADASFAEAVSCYKDEHRLFALIGKALMNAGEIKRALPYLKKGVEMDGADKEMAALLKKCARLREEMRNEAAV